MNHLDQWVTWFVPTPVEQDERQQSANRLLVYICLITSAFSLLYMATAWGVGFDIGAILMLDCFVLLFAVLFIFRATGLFRLSSNLYLANCFFVAVLGCSFFSGGLYSPVFPWFALVPVAAVLLFGYGRDVLLWFLLCCGIALAFGVAGVSGFPFPQRYHLEFIGIFTAICIGGLVMILFFIALAFDLNRNLAMRLILEQNDALREARAQAEAAVRVKSDFLANMSHEIRTPMNAVIGMSRLCLGTNLQPRQRDYVEKVHRAGQSLLGIINDILDFSKIEAGMLRTESIPFHLNQVFDSLASFTATKAQEKGLELLFQLPTERACHLVGDPLRLGQVLLNLVSNAVKFTERGEIQVQVLPLRITADTAQLEFRIKDTGIGMTTEQCGRMFRSFSQADTSTTRKYGGTGLGLAISKRLVEMMGGGIRLESQPGVGTTFIFSASFGRAREADMPKKNQPPADLKQLRVLVVDDVASARQMLEAMLAPFSCRVTCVDSGQAALSALESAAEDDPYRLVLMDWSMPEMDGIEASRRIKSHPRLAAIPTVIMVTAHGREMIMEQAATVGLDGFLVKPVTPSMLVDSIAGIFNARDGADPAGSAETWGIRPLHDIHNAHVLVVEDNAINQQIARELLRQAGLRVTVANNGREALDLVEREQFDAVLMDLQMPIMDGFEATQVIRGIPALARLPIIAMTANAMANDRERCLAAGMNDHVAKPIDPELLFKSLSTWIAPVPRPAAAAATPEMAAGRLPDSLPGIDVALALRGLGGDTVLLNKILVNFRDDHRGDAQAIRRALDGNDMQLAQRIAHTLKGISGSIRATALQSAATALDAALTADASAGYADLLAALESALASVTDGLAGLDQDEAATRSAALGSGSADVGMLQPLLDELASLLLDMDPDAEIAADRLRRQLGAGTARPLADALMGHLAKFDFDAASHALARLREELKASS